MRYPPHYFYAPFLLFLMGCNLTEPEIEDKSGYMDSLNYPFPVKYATVLDGIELAYVDEGRGDHTLLFIHGLGSYLPAWTKNIASLKEQYRCVAIDLPNYGKSRPGNYFFSVSFFARTVDAFIKKLGLENVVLVGHSMGGQIAMTMALDLDTDIEKIVLIAPAGFETFNEAEKQWLRQVYTPALILSATDEQIKQNFDLNFASGQLPADAWFMYEDRRRMREDLVYYTSYSMMISMCVSSMLDQPVFDRLHQVLIPTMVIFGREDQLIPNRILHPDQTAAAVAERGRARLPESDLSLLSPCGHFVQWECAGRVNSHIRAFVQ